MVFIPIEIFWMWGELVEVKSFISFNDQMLDLRNVTHQGSEKVSFIRDSLFFYYVTNCVLGVFRIKIKFLEIEVCSKFYKIFAILFFIWQKHRLFPVKHGSWSSVVVILSFWFSSFSFELKKKSIENCFSNKDKTVLIHLLWKKSNYVLLVVLLFD